jgi:hypothetical protein
VPWQQLMKCAIRPREFQVQNMTVLCCLGQEEIPVQVQGTVKYSIKILYLETCWGIQRTLSPLIMDSHQVLYTTTILVGIRGYRLTFGTGVLHLIQINHQPDAIILQFIILTFVYSSTCFRRFPSHHQELNDCSGSLWFYLCIAVSGAVFVVGTAGRTARPRTQHGYHHDT